MNRTDRTEEPIPDTAQHAYERLGYTRCEADQVERELTRLRERQAQLRQQIDATDAENRALERELLQKLASWRKLDDAHQRVEDVMPQLKAVTGSLTYRGTAALLRFVNRVRKAVLPRRGK